MQTSLIRYSNQETIHDEKGNAYKVGGQLGKGAFGEVKVGYEHRSNKKVAIKIQNITRQKTYHQRVLIDPIIAMQYTENQLMIEETLLRVTGQYLGSLRKSDENHDDLHFTIMQYHEGKPIRCCFSEQSTLKKYGIISELVSQVEVIHKNGYLHLDIWRDNILFGESAILHDFGCAAKLENSTAIGKLRGSHIPPENIAQSKNNQQCIYSQCSDVYALGMTFYELLYEDYFDYSLDKSLDGFLIRYDEYYRKVEKNLGSDTKNPLAPIISRMIEENPNNRVSMDEVADFLSRQINTFKESFKLQ